MTDPFYSPKRRIARAKRDLAKLGKRISKFFKKQPYARVVEPDPDSAHQLHKIKLTKSLPEGFTELAYDIIDGLRSALDQTVYPIAVACNTARPDRVQFPIADTTADFENILNGQCKGLPADILTLLRAFQPYKGGNDVVWALNRIRRQGYHRLLVPVGMASGTTRIHYMHIQASGGEELPPPRWDSEKNEIVFLRANIDTKVDYNLQFTFSISFGEVEGVSGQPVLGFLNAATGEVERIVLAIEAEARRIGLIA